MKLMVEINPLAGFEAYISTLTNPWIWIICAAFVVVVLFIRSQNRS